ncbi:MAG: RHS repeat domain-containing protein [Anaerolineae bacterium]
MSIHFWWGSGRSVSATLWESSYQYDPAGNITSIATLANGESDAKSFSYDANGNMTTRNDRTGSYSQTWDVENRLVQVTDNGGGVTTFTYDASGNRVKTVKPDGRITYTPFPHYEETIAGATTTRVTYMLGGQMIAVRVSGDPDPANNGRFYLYADHLGSVSAMSDENG